ncbi:hydrogenase maturation protease [Xenococcus sp. PCC 7305]|uniref:hydrogenase maturation protease n=1 Tax=Xenococcus sp. PCC 7305 TaxID=102125 RepID=UPI0002ABED85|nr:hydrogenase maturation protease [Xenococcus sp. PCC 7305]ELS00783.1 hydrogenase maturation protease [Xenococcus sp. PCC 7305]
MAKCLIIGYGNNLRSDDGIGRRVAEVVSSWHWPEMKSLSLPQLTPEIATNLAEADVVIFVDACQAVAPGAVESYALQAVDDAHIRSHFSSPQVMLSLTKMLYGKSPQAWWLVVPGVNFRVGDRLSSVGEQGVAQALIQIKNLVS